MGFDISKIRGKIENVVSVLELSKSQSKTLSDNERNIRDICNQLQETLGDGLQWSDVQDILGEIVPGLVEMIDDYTELEGSDKKAFVVAAVTVIYKNFDPNIPWVPEPFETKLENWLVPKLAAGMVESAYKMYKKYKKSANKD